MRILIAFALCVAVGIGFGAAKTDYHKQDDPIRDFQAAAFDAIRAVDEYCAKASCPKGGINPEFCANLANHTFLDWQTTYDGCLKRAGR